MNLGSVVRRRMGLRRFSTSDLPTLGRWFIDCKSNAYCILPLFGLRISVCMIKAPFVGKVYSISALSCRN